MNCSFPRTGTEHGDMDLNITVAWEKMNGNDVIEFKLKSKSNEQTIPPPKQTNSPSPPPKKTPKEQITKKKNCFLQFYLFCAQQFEFVFLRDVGLNNCLYVKLRMGCFFSPQWLL